MQCCHQPRRAHATAGCGGGHRRSYRHTTGPTDAMWSVVAPAWTPSLGCQGQRPLRGASEASGEAARAISAQPRRR
eukprot:3765984-Alexandrium_andersonii.AAC.1